MAITLFCYVFETQGEAEKRVLCLREKYSDLLADCFLLSDAMEVSPIGRKITSKYGFEANSIFLMRLNRKDQVDRMEEAEALVKTMFGKDKILILWENELKH